MFSHRLIKTAKHSLTLWIVGSAVVLFVASSVRHALMHSTGFDLGIFDQAVYLISQGLPPISSLMGFHILGDHAAFIFYPLAVLYAIYPDVHWLFLVQAVGLALGALPVWALARQAGTSERWAIALAIAYLLYPLIFNVNLFDFHPDVLAPLGLLTAVWAARSHRTRWFCGAIAFVLSLKAVLSLTVAALGIWLLAFEKRRLMGVIALVAGVSWFLLATQWIIPTFSGAPPAAVSRYAEFGSSPLEIAKTLMLNPGLAASQILNLTNLGYLVLLFLPLSWGLSWRHSAALIVALPTILLNLLSEGSRQKDLLHQYSLPALPFLILAVIATVVAGQGWLRQPRWVMIWSLVFFMLLAKVGYFGSRYWAAMDTWQANQEAIALIQTQGGVLTYNRLVPQVSQRPVVKLLGRHFRRLLQDIDYVWLDMRHPDPEQEAIATDLLKHLQHHPQFQLRYQRDDVYLFSRGLS
ncbi:DUF2079 domain-containing protein [Oscillatoria sp. FACHB-1407]|uniref:DUF2079 domain-containing protein n=1 Tax=Oscillatoria sp. FACHB-1407 TaxID=2692847 RepID=UPI0016885936|nr:DUF2079 domain-containing protein [Oscillatoria sp. FACHB-1407]MBD2459544.1 DUF2079 domain-containing protein [Oscillatoria sp. FACHB-1407]